MYLIILYCLVIVLQMYNVMKQISTKIIIKKAFNQHDFFHQSILTWAIFYFMRNIFLFSSTTMFWWFRVPSASAT